MRKILCFKLHPDVDLESAWEALVHAGYVLLYSSEELSGEKEIYAEYTLNVEGLLKHYPFLKEVVAGELPEINWEAQWEAHGADFKDGFVHVDLNPYGFSTVLKLKPGPGFGDLSHPTTHLALEMMPLHVKNKSVVDVGSGSGILSFAAEAMGASSVQGIDIDPEAVEHARQNAALNSSRAAFALPGALTFQAQELTILMNMIHSEQEEAWKDLHLPSEKRLIVITSGILKDGRAAYLNRAFEWGLQLVEQREKDGWCGFCFRR